MTPQDRIDQVQTISRVLLLVVIVQTAVAIVTTGVANKTNTFGLGIVVLLLWLLISAASGLWYCRKLASVTVLSVLFLAWLMSLGAYILISYFGLGWTGLIKGLNG